ncbi:NAD-dependent epimerase/dehydratase family protein [Microbacterium sp. B19]|uniref:NAD-dependent epimerase/dehydratase family protein n=1 Tax=Microbacterium sp. B19 TaxID=96765 RepID=UPI00034D1D25|nr:NAD-dependent epimerase/dehydratase family protein [Microbacterium sp. B19]
MKALITGVAGFVGHTLAKRLLSEGHEVVGIDAITDYYDVSIKRANLASIPAEGFRFVEADLNDADLESLLDGVQWIFHQAGQPGVRKSWGSDFGIYTLANINATQRLLEAARNTPSLERFVYASSSSVYGNAERYPTEETDRPQPMSPYGVSKLAAEHLCSLYAENFGVPTVSLRYFTVYGPGQRTDMAFTRFLRAIVTGDTITIYGTGEQVRDFTFVHDVVDANVRAASIESTPGSVFNVAGGTSISVNGVLELLREICSEPVNVEYREPVAGDVFRTGGSTERITDALQWAPKFTLEEGLREQYRWARKTFASA